MRVIRGAAVGWIVATGLLAPVAASAQLEIAPRIGMFNPVGSLVDEGTLNEKHQGAAILLGGTVRFRADKRLSLEANVTFSPSPAAVTDSFGTTDLTGSAFLADARLIVAVTPITSLWSMYVGAGAGVVSRGGSAWRYNSGVTVPAFVATIGTRTPLYGLRLRRPYPPPRAVMRLELSDYVSRAQFDKGLPTETRPLTHHDVTVSVLFAFPINRR